MGRTSLVDRVRDWQRARARSLFLLPGQPASVERADSAPAAYTYRSLKALAHVPLRATQCRDDSKLYSLQRGDHLELLGAPSVEVDAARAAYVAFWRPVVQATNQSEESWLAVVYV